MKNEFSSNVNAFEYTMRCELELLYTKILQYTKIV